MEEQYFRRSAELAREALARGDDGFGTVLVDENGEIIMEQANEVLTKQNPIAHAELLLIQRAAAKYSKEFLSKCTLYSLVEPCVMCMGAVFWAGIGAVKYAFSEEEMNRILPGGLEIHAKEFAERSPKSIRVFGGYPDIAEKYQAAEIVKEWVRGFGIPGLPVED